MARSNLNHALRAPWVAGWLAVAWASGVWSANDAPSQGSAAVVWPGPDSITATFNPADSPVLYKGEGGTKMSVQGIDFWVIGRPPRANKMLGTVTVDVAALKPKQAPQLTNEEFFSVVQEKVASQASGLGASAAILTSVLKDQRGNAHLYYRVVVYLPENTVFDAPVRNDPTLLDADGNKVANGLETPISTLMLPDISDGNRWRFDGTAVVNVCVGTDGKLTEDSIITSSGHKELDALGLDTMKHGKYSPATVRGRPVVSCKDYRLTWHGH